MPDNSLGWKKNLRQKILRILHISGYRWSGIIQPERISMFRAF
jgi:hypothetical protein